MSPTSDVSIDFGNSSAASSDFEQVSYQDTYWNKHEEELPLHYMSEEKARRRVARAPGAGTTAGTVGDNADYSTATYDSNPLEYDDEGKDVYAKARQTKGRVGSGRVMKPPPPPPTSIVSNGSLMRLWVHQPLARWNKTILTGFWNIARIRFSKSRTYPTCCIYSSVMLDPLSCHWQGQRRRLGRGALWQIRLSLP
jgi:hypothetical protein